MYFQYSDHTRVNDDKQFCLLLAKSIKNSDFVNVFSGIEVDEYYSMNSPVSIVDYSPRYNYTVIQCI